VAEQSTPSSASPSNNAEKPDSKPSADKLKPVLLIGVLALILLGGGLWYAFFSPVPPPPVKKAETEKVVEYLVDKRGFQKLSIADREQYLKKVYAHFGEEKEWTQVGRMFRRMPRKQLENFRNAVFEIAKTRFLEHARKFNDLPPEKRPEYLDKIFVEFTQMGQKYGSNAGQAKDAAAPFREVLPQSNDELVKFIVTQTSDRERREAGALYDALLQRYANLESN
jgi:DNA-directed RNA polymerase subunit F